MCVPNHQRRLRSAIVRFAMSHVESRYGIRLLPVRRLRASSAGCETSALPNASQAVDGQRGVAADPYYKLRTTWNVLVRGLPLHHQKQAAWSMQWTSRATSGGEHAYAYQAAHSLRGTRFRRQEVVLRMPVLASSGSVLPIIWKKGRPATTLQGMCEGNLWPHARRSSISQPKRQVRTVGVRISRSLGQAGRSLRDLPHRRTGLEVLGGRP